MNQIESISPEAISAAVHSFFEWALNPREEIKLKLPITLHGTCQHPITGVEFGVYPENLVGSLLRRGGLGMDLDRELEPFVVVASFAGPEKITQSPGTVYVTFQLHYHPDEDTSIRDLREPFFSLTLMGFPGETFWGFGSFDSFTEVNRDLFEFAVTPTGAISLAQVRWLEAHFKAIRFLLKSLQELLPDLPILRD